jgi:phosphoglycerate dehydrogenase-like enzyme
MCNRLGAVPPLIIWCNASLGEPARALLREGTRGHRLVVPPAGLVAPSGSAVKDATLAEADVVYGQPDPEQLLAAPRLRWVHLSSAGYGPYERADVRGALRAQGARLTKSSMVYDEPCAEHVLAFMLADARRLGEAFANAAGPRAWPQHALRGRARLLEGQSVVIAGFGSIGRRLVELLAPFGMKVSGLRRRVAGDEPVPTFAWGSPEAARALAEADHVVDVLPGSADTRNAFDAARLAGLKPGAVFYNIGRGTTVDQEALRAALLSGRLAAAYLDVAEPEPLPPEHPLWTTPSCFITPHAAGGHANETERSVRHFLDNLARFTAGEALADEIS